MQGQNASSSDDSKQFEQPLLKQRSPMVTSRPSFSPFRVSIRHKIGAGYGLAVGVALLGTVAGLLVGDLYQNRAQKQLTEAVKQEQLLNELQRNVLHMRLHQHEFIVLAAQPKLFQDKHDHFRTHIAKTQKILPELQAIAITTDATSLVEFLRTSQGIVDAYFQQLETFLTQTHGLHKEPAKVARQQAWLSNFALSETSLKFDSLLNDLVNLIEATRQNQQQAEVALDNAKVLRTQIIVLSMLLSIAIATTLAILTSRAIAQPLETVTNVAQQVTQESNFSLRAPVNTTDEVGVLATSLNGLIQRVAEYTDELQLTHQTLERRVEARTAELWQKNEQLEIAHQNLQQLNDELSSQAEELSQALQDLQAAQTQLIQAEKMSSLGQMVAGVAHEINNPINFISANLNHARGYSGQLIELIHLYQQEYPDSTLEIKRRIQMIDLEFIVNDLPKVVASMQVGADRIREIVLSLRNFSRLDEAAIKTVDIHEGIDNTLLILNHRLTPDISIHKEYAELPLVECYPAQLNQAFMHLLDNAIDAVLSKSDATPKQILIRTELSEDDQVKIRIVDNGPGINAEVKNKIFDPFFTTKPVGRGTGLGLSMCYQIAKKHQGQIEVVSEPGQGAEFAIALPVKAVSSTVTRLERSLMVAAQPLRGTIENG